MRTLFRWLVDTLMYLAAVVLSFWAASWPNFSIDSYNASVLLDWAGFMLMLWVVNVPAIVARPLILLTLRNRATGSLSRVNYLAGSLALTVVWFSLLARKMSVVAGVIGAVVVVLSHSILSFVTPVKIHKNGRLAEPV